RLAGQHTDLAEEIPFAEAGKIDRGTGGTVGEDLHLAAGDDVHRRTGLPFADDDAPLIVRLELHLADEGLALFLVQDLEERRLRHRTREERIALPCRRFLWLGRRDLIAQLLPFAGHCDG